MVWLEEWNGINVVCIEFYGRDEEVGNWTSAFRKFCVSILFFFSLFLFYSCLDLV